MVVGTQPHVKRSDPRGVVTTFVGYAILIFFGLVFLYPFVIQLANAFKTEPDATANPLSPIPDPVTTDSVARIFSGTDFPVWLGNSLLMAVVITSGRRLHHEAVLRVDPGERRGGRAHRRGEPVPHVLVGGAADGAAGRAHADHPRRAELLERVPAHAGRRAGPVAVHAAPRPGRPGQRFARRRDAVPAQARRGVARHGPDRHRVRGVPALLRARRDGGRRKGLTRSGVRG